jgi:hypothetical protein
MILPRRLRVASFLLMSLLAAGPLAAVVHRSQEVRQPRLSVTGLLSEAWVLVSRILGREGSGTDPFGKEGGSTDPFGNPKPPSGSTSPEPASGQ